MMRWIVGSSLRFRFIVVAVAAGMMFFGIAQLRSIPVDVFPEFAPPRVQVQTACLGLSAADVEQLVTVPLEDALNGMPGLDVMRSSSVPQLSSIELIFKLGTNLLHARQLVQERMATVLPTLPTWAAPPVMLQPLSATSRVMKIGLSSKSRSLIEMSTISYWTIRARLLRVPGVANVPIWGERLQMLQVQVEPERMKAHDVSLEQVMETTADALDVGLLKFSNGSVVGTGGFIDTPNQRIGIRNVLPITSPKDLAQVPIEGRGHGKPLRLGDVAKVVEDHQALAGDAVINDGPGLMLIVEKLPWANTLDVTRGVDQALEELKPGLTGIDIDATIFRPASFIETALHNLTVALLLGCLFVILVLGAFLFEWRSALISLVAIPLSLMAAAMVLYFRDVTINTMMMAARERTTEIARTGDTSHEELMCSRWHDLAAEARRIGFVPMHVITVTEQHRVDVAIPETRQHVHAFGGNDFGIGWNLQRTDGANSLDALVFDDDHAVRERVAAKAVDQATAD